MSTHKADCNSRLGALHQNLVSIEDLIRQFNAYRLSYAKLLIEIARRRRYKEETENILRGMMTQLETMSEGMFFLFLHRTANSFIRWTNSQRSD